MTTTLQKGQVLERCMINHYADSGRLFQDKKLWDIRMTQPVLLNAQLVTPAMAMSPGIEVLKPVNLVVLSPGDGTKAPWLKVDQPKTEYDLRDKLFVSRDAVRMAVDMAAAGKLEPAKIQEQAKKFAHYIFQLSTEL